MNVMGRSFYCRKIVLTQDILLISYYSPSRGHAGGQRLLDLYAQIRRINPEIYLGLLTCRHAEADWGLDKVNDIFNEVHWLSGDSFNPSNIEIQNEIAQNYDLIDLQYHQSGMLIDMIRKLSPNSKVIFSPMESQIRAFKLAATKHFSNLTIKSILGLLVSAIKELYYCFRANRVGCVSLADLDVLKIFVSEKKLYLIETGFSQTEFPEIAFKDDISNSDHVCSNKRKLVFLAYFGSKTNRDALRWFCKNIHPSIRAQVSCYELMVLGRGLDESLLRECTDEGINWVGEVECIASIFSSATAGIAPALSGAGIRGKIHQYAISSIPCVASSIGVDSLKYTHGENIFLADSASDFSSYCITLLSDPKVSRKMGESANALCLSEYSWDSMAPNIKNLYFE